MTLKRKAQLALPGVNILRGGDDGQSQKDKILLLAAW